MISGSSLPPGLDVAVELALIWVVVGLWTRKEAARYSVAVSFGTAAMIVLLSYLYAIGANLHVSVMLAYLIVVPLAISAILSIIWLVAYVVNIFRGGVTLKAHIAHWLPIVLMVVGSKYMWGR